MVFNPKTCTRIFSLCLFMLAGMTHFAYSQSGSFTVSKTVVSESASNTLDITISLQSGRAQVFEFTNPFGEGVAVEMIRKNGTDIWLTSDSVLFLKNLPKTAFVKNLGSKIRLALSQPVNGGETLSVRLVMGVPMEQTRGSAKSNPGNLKIQAGQSLTSRLVSLTNNQPITIQKRANNP